MSGAADLRAVVLATANPAPVPADVPGWPGVHMRPMLVSDVEAVKAAENDAYRMARGLARVLCTAEGEMLFDADSEEDLKALSALPASYLLPLNRKAESLNATTIEEAQALGNG